MQSKLEQGRRTIFTTNQIFNIFQLFILAATIALLFPIDGYQIFIIEYRCKKKKLLFYRSSAHWNMVLQAFRNNREIDFNARHVAPTSIYAIPFCNLLRGSNWIFLVSISLPFSVCHSITDG